MKRVRIVLAFGMLILFSFLIWGKPNVTGKATGELSETVVVILKAQSSSAITGAVAFDEKTPSLDELKVSTAIAQQEVLDDVNSPSFFERLFGIVPSPDVEAERKLDIVPAMVVEATQDGIAELEDHPLVEAVYPDIQFELALANTVPLINADDVWRMELGGQNIDGRGRSVCVIDTGISPHVDFQDRIVNQQCFCSPNCCPNGQGSDALATDTHSISHGTHVSGIIGANGPVYKGVAPGVNIVAVKVCNLGCGLSDIFAGIDYCLRVKDQFNVVAISGSIGDGGNYQVQGQCPTYFDAAIDAAYNAGIVSVFASGNNGYPNGVSYPGCNVNSIGVGATDRNDFITGFTNRGQLLDVLAPGLSVISTKANNQYGPLSGTSQATPHVSGLVALLSQYAELRGLRLAPDQMRQILQDTGRPVGAFKRVDSLAAVQSLSPPNTPPVASIISPVEGATVNSPVSLEGSGSDAEDGLLASEKLSWSSELGPIGIGASVRADLPVGTHTIALTATDGALATGQAVVRFTVEPAPSPSPIPTPPPVNSPPDVRITTPANSVLSSPVTLDAAANDPEDGVLVGSWYEGETRLGSGNQITVPLPPGAHTITFSAQDSQSTSVEDSVSFTSQTCRLNIDQNNNNQFDIGDLVVLISGFFSENLRCNVEAVNSFCITELDMNSNGALEIGDLVLLLRSYSEESLSC